MTISFLVPVYNTEKYLARCIDSLLIQKGADFEIVLLDDGSTDSSGAICDRYAAQYPGIVRVIHKENEGLLMTRRRGFAEARGDWFICVDSDDYVAPELLETVVKTIEDTGADMVMYNFEYFDEKEIHSPSRISMKHGAQFEGDGKQRLYQERLLTVDFNSMCTRAVKRTLIDFDTDYRNCGVRNMCEDALQVLPVYTNAKKTVYLDTPLYFYRKWSGSTTARYSMERWESSQACFLHTEKYLNIWNVSDEVAARFYTKHLEFLCNYVRWLFSAETGELPASVPKMTAQLKAAPDFILCRKHYRREYAHSRYLSIVVPVLTHLVEKNNITGIRTVLRLENQLLKIKKR